MAVLSILETVEDRGDDVSLWSCDELEAEADGCHFPSLDGSAGRANTHPVDSTSTIDFALHSLQLRFPIKGSPEAISRIRASHLCFYFVP